MTSHLGFYDLMNIAEQNIEETARKSKSQQFASFTPSAAKKQTPKQKKLSENVAKFLAKKEQEKKKEQEEARRKREHLLALRSQDKKATKRVGQMLRMTKSANKAVISDAMNCLSDSLAEQGEYQPDEDDYGYVSQYAEEFHKKMVAKYKNIPVSKSSKKSAVPVPIVQSLKTSNNAGSAESTSRSSIAEASASEPNHKKSKPKKSVPPPFNFHDLMDLAKQKCQEPVLLKTSKPVVEEEKYEFGRPMTAKEKAEYLKERAIRERISVPNFDTRTCASNDRNNNKRPVNSSEKSSQSFKIPNKKAKSGPVSQPPTPPPPPPPKAQPVPPVKTPATPPPPRPAQSANRAQMSSSNASNIPAKLPKSKPANAPQQSLPQSSYSRPSSPPPPRVVIKEERKSPPPKSSNTSLPSVKQRSQGPPQREREVPREKLKSKSDKMDMDRRNTSQNIAPKIKSEFDREEVYHAKQSSHTNQISRQPQPQNRNRSEQEIQSRPRDKISKQAPGAHRPNPKQESQASKPKPTGRQIIDSDEEEEEDYDSEMDDFIDDSDIHGNDISDIIRQITGYDKRRYKDGSDDECMESSAYEQMREESRSLRIGIKEDLEDMRLEAEEKKRKAQMKKLKMRKK